MVLDLTAKRRFPVQELIRARELEGQAAGTPSFDLGGAINSAISGFKQGLDISNSMGKIKEMKTRREKLASIMSNPTFKAEDEKTGGVMGLALSDAPKDVLDFIHKGISARNENEFNRWKTEYEAQEKRQLEADKAKRDEADPLNAFKARKTQADTLVSESKAEDQQLMNALQKKYIAGTSTPEEEKLLFGMLGYEIDQQLSNKTQLQAGIK